MLCQLKLKMQIITLVRCLYILHHPDACGESWKTQKQLLMGWGDWLCPHFSLYCSLRGCCHCSLVGLPLVELCLPGVLKASLDVLETASKRGMTQMDSNVHSSCIHGCLWLNTLRLFSFTQQPRSPSRHLTSVWLGRKSNSSRPVLENAFRKGSPGKCQGHPPCPVGSSQQLILCRRQLQGREMLMLCMSLLLLQPWGCLLLQPTARNFQAVLLGFTRDLLIALKC